MARSRLLLTGAKGRLGRVLAPALADVWEVLATDLELPDQDTFAGMECAACDITDETDVRATVQGCAAVVHLAAISEEASPRATAEINILGTSNVLEACYQEDVGRVVLASSNHAVGGYERFSAQLPPQEMIDEDALPWPDSHYGASKVHMEGLARWYVHRPGSRLSAACLRIGTAGFTDLDQIMRNERLWSTWLSDRDLVGLVRAALEASITFGVYYGVSDNRRRFWSLEAVQRDLGYAPVDDAEELARERGFESDGYHLSPWQE